MKRLCLILACFALVACDEGSTAATPPPTTQPAAAAAPPPAACEACESCAAPTDAAATTPAAGSAMSLTAPTTQPTYNARAAKWLPPGQRDEPFDLDYHATDQDGRSFTLTELVGKPIVLSFIFTRCGNPKMCAAITVQMANLQRSLEAADLADDVHVVLMSYDPVYDTPKRLKKFATDRGFRFTAGDMIFRPNVDEYRDLISEFSIAIAPLPDGTINHAMELMVIDAKGRFVRDYQGDLWDNAPIVEDVRKLVAEGK